ncbi:4Fe-4S dicluster domain-containing protein [Effusibacillus lacus]|uniref:4Fe-4S ferredoxin n=1 Tax=Effusibacillus lacus TaxID=1348429 RepID=A0A292YKD4_9BACL|nr:4Fe-4S dicluster domain-containing protein [Effusibacillus lacus]TCS71806.1 formate dehydrogenase (quinone-dependent) iron-sulfur subunit [Effusibacillus lacus]GAX89626.1 4Fe-4S ferredoxin [Effusibacillus lacus]
MPEFVKLVDVTKCTGCRACMVACKNWNDLPAERQEFQGSIQSHKKTTAHTWNVVTYTEYEQEDGSLDWLFRHSACLHCKEAACVKVCPENAIGYTKFGSVVIDSEKCIGCGYCVNNCPFKVVELAEYKDEQNDKTYYKAQKCTLCTNRLEKNMQPACAVTCPTDAIVFGEQEAMLKQAEARLAEIKPLYPNANIYNPPGVGGTHAVYVLPEKPSVFGLPEDPRVPLSATIWKDYAQPIGKALFGVTTMAVIGAFISNSLFRRHENLEQVENEGGSEQ